MSRQAKFGIALAILTAALLFFAVGCAPTAEQIKVIQSDVAAIGSIAKDNPKLTQWDRARLGYHVDRVIKEVGDLK